MGLQANLRTLVHYARLFGAPPAGAQSSQTALLKATAHDEITAIQAVDQQIHAAVASYRAQFPGGKWSSKKPLPPLPPILHTLQVTRDNITLNHLASLQSGFGADFQRFDTYVQGALGPHITVTAIPPQATAPPANTAPPGNATPPQPVPWKQ